MLHEKGHLEYSNFKSDDMNSKTSLKKKYLSPDIQHRSTGMKNGISSGPVRIPTKDTNAALKLSQSSGRYMQTTEAFR
jgi:hypothetical protein